RGRDHVRELTARAVAELRAAGVPAAEARLLGRRGRAEDSAGLSAAQRRANLAGTFALRPGPREPAAGTVLVVVDDVVTSGATLTEAAAVLAPVAGAAGAPVFAAVVAATPRRPSGAARHGSPAAVPRGSLRRLSGPGNGD
ncbi:MAG: ComF family protein, partial [Actinomycetota bacterium]|nr:ComF family protein [Actinomycetota bacterium]